MMETILDQFELFGMTSFFINRLFKLPAEQTNKKTKPIEKFQYVSETVFGRRLVDSRANVFELRNGRIETGRKSKHISVCSHTISGSQNPVNE